jgi:geranylgeranyl transferase type-1 subunit beta
MTGIDTRKGIAYNKLCLNLLPGLFKSNDLNRLSLGFFLLNALDILSALEEATSATSREHWISWIYNCQLPSGAGFRGSPATITPLPSIYDTDHLPATYFALAALLILGDDLSRVKRKEILLGLKAHQNLDGSFAPVLVQGERFGEVDLRHGYCACAIREILGPVSEDEDFDVSAAVRYVNSAKVLLLKDWLTVVL